MKLSLLGALAAILAIIPQFPAHARSWAMLVECHFISANGNEQIDDTCRVEGSSGQGMTSFNIIWKDGVQTSVSGNFATGQGYTVDQRPAVMKEINDVTILRTNSGNIIIFRRLRDLN
ncbi:MAG: hypothetical protein KME18_16865 [Phormidium tanganyikae FI6-MK23]|jgi:hypothetical protein|nr:hypothetical protein [Phormidium tanganyikae FI6-MK23]